ncbi:MAG: hypothetical protein JSS02_30510 [Planctomycetes bacterium]|nr:hypothetical protein [Planctomycetota bacterium]
MSEHAVATPSHSETATGTAFSPDFDRREIDTFGKEDGQAITVIGKMLVLFFFYSLLVMSAVAIWTLTGKGQTPSQPAHATHGDSADSDE